jgi:putative ABC transport system permease protein
LKLARALILRPLRRDLLRTALTVMAVALGVAVVVAIDLAGDAATGSFRSSLATLAGSTDLQIAANGGIDEQWIARLAALPFNARFAPVLETQAQIEGIGAVPLYGVDLLGKPDLIVAAPLARRLRARPGDTLKLLLNDRAQTFRIGNFTSGALWGGLQAARGFSPASVPKLHGYSGVDPDDAEFVALDIAEAQKALDSYGKLDRIDVQVRPDEDLGKVEQSIRALLPSGYTIDRPGARSAENQRMLRAFRWNLRVLSYISLVVGAFLIYNTISISVVRRRPEIGVLRALGASRQAVLWLFLAEALLLGLVGSALGLLSGRALAAAAVGMIAQTVNALYVSSRPAEIALGGGEIATGIIAGLVVAALSAFGPAREAMEVTPTEAMGRGAHEHRARLDWRRDLACSAMIAALAFLASLAGPVDGMPVGGYAAALLAIIASAMASPAAVLAMNRCTRIAARKFFGPEGLLAGRSLAGSLARSSVVAGALATAIAMMASVGIMVGSFRETVVVWLDTQLRADLYVRPAARTGAGQYPALSADVPAIAASLPGVAAVDVLRAMELRYAGERATLGAADTDLMRRYGRLRFLPGEDRDAILRSLPGQDRAILSEPFANRHRLRQGDRLDLALGSRTVSLAVAGIYYDYSTQGYVMLDRSTLLKHLPGRPPTNLAIYLERGVDAGGVRQQLQMRLAAYRVVVAANRSLRRDAIAIFDRTFAITYALEAVAIIVAMLGAANSLLALVLDRRREMGLLRYLGASAAQIRRMVLLEAGFIGLVGALIGLALGFVLSLLLIYVVNKQSFGWTIQFHPPAGLLAGALLAVWCVTVVAGLYPARVAARLNPIEVIHEE